MVLEYGHTADHIDIEVAVEHRVPNIYADIVVYADKSLKKPLIAVECTPVTVTVTGRQLVLSRTEERANRMPGFYFTA